VSCFYVVLTVVLFGCLAAQQVSPIMDLKDSSFSAPVSFGSFQDSFVIPKVVGSCSDTSPGGGSGPGAFLPNVSTILSAGMLNSTGAVGDLTDASSYAQ